MSKLYNYLENEKVLIVGYGKSGIEASNLVNKLGGKAIVYDDRTNLNLEHFIEKAYSDVSEIPFDEISLIVLSPGVSLETEIAKACFESGKETIGEIEFGYRYSKGKIFAITGTNGKTTTVTLLGKIIKEDKKDTIVVGNVGLPFTACVENCTDDTHIVLEASSFQLETIKEFVPVVSVITNMTEDHLNRHKTMENYLKSKFEIAKNQGEGNFLVLNLDDKLLKDYVKENILNDGLKIVWVTTRKDEEDAVDSAKKINEEIYENYLKNRGFSDREEKEKWINKFEKLIKNPCVVFQNDENIVYYDGNQKIDIVKKENIKILGRHNVENVMFAGISAFLEGISVKAINSAISRFIGVEHRIEFVKEYKNVRYYNDSKGTNPDATIQAVLAMDRPTILLLGGSDKKISFKELIKELNENIKEIIIYGEVKDFLAKELSEEKVEFIMEENMKTAFKKASEIAKEGENVLLSPACASFDEFSGFEERGRIFKELVEKL